MKTNWTDEDMHDCAKLHFFLGASFGCLIGVIVMLLFAILT